MSDDRPSREVQHPFMEERGARRRLATPEERRFLEALVFWRGLYAARGSQDRNTIGSLRSIIAAADRQMRKSAIPGGQRSPSVGAA